MKHPWVWMAWLAVALVLLSTTRNPLYLLIILLCVFVVSLALHRERGETAQTVPVWKFGLGILLLATLFNAFTSHYGSTVLFTIPGTLPLLSGNVTLEAIVYGATNGLVLTGMLAAFNVLNLALPTRALISLIPRAFFPIAVVTSIAVTYLPTTLRQFRQIRDAQAVRGHQMKTLRDWLPLLMPLLVGGMEHAMQLAEAMTARGFLSTQAVTAQRHRSTRVFMLAGLLLLGIGWVLQLGGNTVIGRGFIALGAILILGGLWQLGRQSQRRAYHPARWGWQDFLTLLLMAVVVVICLLPIPGIHRESLFYEPYPRLALPPFNPLIGFTILFLLLPGLLLLKRINQEPL